MNISEILSDLKIHPRTYSNGSQRVKCPDCSHTRKKKHDRPLALTIEPDKILWYCHHCGWSGIKSDGDQSFGKTKTGSHNSKRLRRDRFTGALG